MDIRSLLKKDDLRRLNLIEKLCMEPFGVPSDSLLAYLGCSLPAFLDDIRKINMQNFTFTIIKENSHYRFQSPQPVLLDEVYQTILNGSLEMKIIDQLLFEDCYSLAELSQALFCGQTQAYRSLNSVAAKLKKMNIDIAKKPYRLEGSEKLIRHFYYLFYREKQAELTHFRCSILIQSEAEQFINRFLEQNALPKSWILTQRLLYTFFISLWRIKNDHLLPEREFGKHRFVYPETAPALGALLVNAGKKNKALGLKESLWLLTCDCLLLKEAQLTTAELRPRIQRICSELRRLIGELEALLKTELNTQLKTELLLVLFNAHSIYKRDSSFAAVLSQQKNYFLKNAEAAHPKTYKKLERFLQKFLRASSLPAGRDFVQNSLYLILTALPECFEWLEQAEPLKKILVLSVVAPTQEMALSYQLQTRLQRNVRVEKSDTIPVEEAEFGAQLAGYDLIISTQTLPFSLPVSKPLIGCNGPVTEALLQQIRSVLDLPELQKPSQVVKKIVTLED